MMFTRDDNIRNSNNYIWFKCKYMLHEHMAYECVNVPTLEPADPACGVRVVSPATPVLDSARFPHRRWKDKQIIYKHEYLDSKYKIYLYKTKVDTTYLGVGSMTQLLILRGAVQSFIFPAGLWGVVQQVVNGQRHRLPWLDTRVIVGYG